MVINPTVYYELEAMMKYDISEIASHVALNLPRGTSLLDITG